MEYRIYDNEGDKRWFICCTTPNDRSQEKYLNKQGELVEYIWGSVSKDTNTNFNSYRYMIQVFRKAFPNKKLPILTK